MKKDTLVVVAVTLVLAACSRGSSGAKSSAQLRLSPADLAARGRTNDVAPGTSGMQGIETAYVSGDPKAAGIYTILLRIPANTRIAAHTHPDDRVATVVSGTWYFGYGSRHEDAALRPLPPGSFYTEPPAVEHFARTGETPVVLLITGYGPTGTEYVDRGDDPRRP